MGALKCQIRKTILLVILLAVLEIQGCMSRHSSKTKKNQTGRATSKQSVPQEKVECQDENRNRVPWFIAYKLPKLKDAPGATLKEGTGYSYILPGYTAWRPSNKRIGHSDSMVGNTLRPYFQRAQSPDLAYMVYNDQPPYRDDIGYNGHSKGIILGKKNGGLWLVHSVPKFPLIGQDFYPTNGLVNAQMFLCVSLSATELDNVANIFKFTRPIVSNSSVPNSLSTVFPTWKAFLAIKRFSSKDPVNKMFNFTAGKLNFQIFAKSPKFEKDEAKLDEDIMVLCSIMSTASPSPSLPKSRRIFELNSFTDDECFINFRFRKNDIPRLRVALRVPEKIVCRNGTAVDGIEGLCILLRRFAYPNRYVDLMKTFPRSKSELSYIFNALLRNIIENNGVLLTSFDIPILERDKIVEYAQAIGEKGAALKNCWGFLDGTVRAICRPQINQREFYNGHKRTHAEKFQSIMLPNGLIGNMFGPMSGRRHDAALLAESGILAEIENRMNTAGGLPLCLYGDPAYPLRQHLLVPFRGNLSYAQQRFNSSMSTVREAVEWGFEIYVEWLAPTLRSSLEVQSWLSGSNAFVSNCTSTNFPVYNIAEKRVGGEGFKRNDHSKWAVGVENANPWVCISDLNRMEGQKSRGGATLCILDEKVWTAFKSSVTDLQPCARAG